MLSNEQTLSVSDARTNFTEVVNYARYKGGTTVVTHRGKPTCRVVPVEAAGVSDCARALLAAWNALPLGTAVNDPAFYPLAESMRNLRIALGGSEGRKPIKALDGTPLTWFPLIGGVYAEDAEAAQKAANSAITYVSNLRLIGGAENA